MSFNSFLAANNSVAALCWQSQLSLVEQEKVELDKLVFKLFKVSLVLALGTPSVKTYIP